MKAPIDFYFDFASPYAYFLADALDELARRHGRVVHWRPLMLWAVLKEHGMAPPLEHAVKRAYMLQDMDRSARHYGKAFRLPTSFPLSSHLPARVFYHLQAQDGALALRFARQVFSAYFTQEANIADATAIQDIGASCGVAREVIAAGLADGSAKETLRQVIAEAQARGVFGSPFVFIDGEAYFGADRLPQIEAALARAD